MEVFYASLWGTSTSGSSAREHCHPLGPIMATTSVIAEILGATVLDGSEAVVLQDSRSHSQLRVKATAGSEHSHRAQVRASFLGESLHGGNVK